MKKILELEHISKYIFNVATGKPVHGTTVKILNDVSFDLYEGEVHALLGENGAGKSTLMKIIGGVIPYDEGSMKLNGQPVSFLNARQARANGIAFVHQELNLCTNLDVAHNFYLANEPSGKFGLMKQKQMYAESAKAIRALGFELDTHTKLGKLSTAQQQIVEISKALSYDSKIIIMDEPTASLSQKEIDMLFALIGQLKKQGISIIYISHRLDEIQRIGDRMTVMRDGCYISSFPREQLEETSLISMMVGREIKNMFPKSNTPTTDEFFRVEHLTGGRFTDISFSLNRGEILGVAGLMGAGRTEIMRAIFGLDPLTAGTITMNGKVLRIRSSRDALDQGIGYVSEDRRSVGLVLGMTVRDNITMSNLSQYCRHSWIRYKEEKRVADEQIREFSIKTPSAEQIAANLSGGNQQKIVLSKTLLCQPEVIILDEPTRGIDVGAKAEIHKMISALASQGKGIIMISSEMPEILGMSDRIIVIHEGRKKGELLRENASQQAIMEMMLAQ